MHWKKAYKLVGSGITTWTGLARALQVSLAEAVELDHYHHVANGMKFRTEWIKMNKPCNRKIKTIHGGR